jgi:hypothetical protein
MYEGCETVLAPLVAVVQATLTRLRRDRFEVGRSGPGDCGGADVVLYVCGHVPRRREEVSVGGQGGLGIRPGWGTFAGVGRGVEPKSSSISLSEPEGGDCECFCM